MKETKRERNRKQMHMHTQRSDTGNRVITTTIVRMNVVILPVKSM